MCDIQGFYAQKNTYSVPVTVTVYMAVKCYIVLLGS